MSIKKVLSTKKSIPAWYRIFIESKIRNLETALTQLDLADKCLDMKMIFTAKSYITEAKQTQRDNQ